jgi:hypothetical protein
MARRELWAVVVVGGERMASRARGIALARLAHAAAAAAFGKGLGARGPGTYVTRLSNVAAAAVGQCRLREAGLVIVQNQALHRSESGGGGSGAWVGVAVVQNQALHRRP